MKQEQNQQTERLLLKPKRVALLTDQAPSQVYKLIADGTYPSIRIGRSVRVPLEALRRVLGLGDAA